MQSRRRNQFRAGYSSKFQKLMTVRITRGTWLDMGFWASADVEIEVMRRKILSIIVDGCWELSLQHESVADYISDLMLSANMLRDSLQHPLVSFSIDMNTMAMLLNKCLFTLNNWHGWNLETQNCNGKALCKLLSEHL